MPLLPKDGMVGTLLPKEGTLQLKEGTLILERGMPFLREWVMGSVRLEGLGISWGETSRHLCGTVIRMSLGGRLRHPF